MPRRRCLPCLLAVALAGAPAAADAAGLPTTTRTGVSVRLDPPNGFDVVFSATRAGRLAYREVGGRADTIRCVRLGTALSARLSGRATIHVRLPRTRSTIRLRPLTGGLNACELLGRHGSVAVLGLDQAARTVLAQAIAGEATLVAFDAASALARRDGTSGYPSAQALAASDPEAFAALPSPSDTPPAGHIGFFSDEARHAAAVAVAADGTRMVADIDAGVVSGNALAALMRIARLGPAPGVPGGDPRAPAPRVPAPIAGVTLVREHGLGYVSFGATPAARRALGALAGHRITARCTAFGPGGLAIGATSSSVADDLTLAPNATRVRVPLATRSDTCSISTRRGRVVAVAVGERGAAILDQSRAAARMLHVLDAAFVLAGNAGTTGFPPATVLAGALSGVSVLPSPGADPPAGRTGFYSDGAGHLAIVAITAAGERLSYELAGDDLRSNALDAMARLSEL